MKDLPFVSLVILVYNRRPQLEESLRLLHSRLDYPPDRMELIVVDNASTDNPGQLGPAYPGVKWIHLEKNVGISGWNHGFSASTGSYILALDDDAHLEGPFLREAVERLNEDPTAGLLSFHVIDPGTGYSYTTFRPFGKFCCWGCCILMTREAWQRTGGFDPGIFLFSHEADFILTLNKEGLRHVHAPDLYSFHRRNPIIREEDMTRHRLYHLAHSMYYTYFKHFHGWRLLVYLFASLPTCLLGDLKNLVFRRKMFGVSTQAWIDALPVLWNVPSTINPAVELDFLVNDIHALPRLVSLLIPIRKWRTCWWHQFYKNRSKEYPEYRETLLGKWIPFHPDGL